MSQINVTNDPVPTSEIPRLKPHNGARPKLPKRFSSTALLHPFGPPPKHQSGSPVPFYQLCLATISYSAGEFFSAQIRGCENDDTSWWYLITPERGVQLSLDEGVTWQSAADTGWALPDIDCLGAEATCAGLSPLNWVADTHTSWWKLPVLQPEKDGKSQAPGATWMWFDHDTPSGQVLPVRMMFGVEPATPVSGTANQLALLQNFSFSWFTDWRLDDNALPMDQWQCPELNGFAPGNPQNQPNFVWAPNQAISVFMTPVNENYNPLPTRVLYRWDDNEQFWNSGGVRGQSTLMQYDYAADDPNRPNKYNFQLALLNRKAEGKANGWGKSVGYDVFYGEKNQLLPYKPGGPSSGPEDFPFGTEAPDWVTIGEGKIVATMQNVLRFCPNETVNVYRVMFPKKMPHYPDGTYLWVWYSPIGGTDSTSARPITFMQSASNLGEGTSLALADYFYFDRPDTPIDAENFNEPPPTASFAG